MLTANVDLTKTPIELTVVSDRRVIDFDVHSAGETTTAYGVWPIRFEETDRVWKLKSDDKKTAVYTA
jgi:hypothetical protein